MNTIKYTIAIMLLTILTSLFSQVGLRKSFVDDRSGQTFNSFRTDSTQAVFRQVLKNDEFLYDDPKNNADARYSLDKNMFVEVINDDPNSDFVNIRILDKFHGIVEGWTRATTLKDQRYYGRSYSEYKNLPSVEKHKEKINPNWISKTNTVVYTDSTLTGISKAVLDIGKLVYLDEYIDTNSAAVYFTKNKVMVRGFVKRSNLSEFAVLKDPSTDLDELFSKFDPALLKHDLEHPGFVSYSGLHFSNTVTEEFTEDKLCKERGKDSLYYRYSLSSDIYKKYKAKAIRGNKDQLNIAMYRILPDEEVITRLDTINCKVVEFVSTPKSAKIDIGETEEANFSSTVTKLMIARIEKFGINIVFQRETNEYNWTYKKDLSSGKIIETNTDIDRVIKRMIAFRKH